MTASGATNYEAGLHQALNWVNTAGPAGPLAGADFNQLVFISDGEPNRAYIANGTTVGTFSASDSMLHLVGQYPGGSADTISEIAAIETAGFTIEAVGIALGDPSTALSRLDDVEDGVIGVNGGGDADNIDTAEELSDVLAALSGGSTINGAAGNDVINGNGGNDLIYGDVLWTDELATNQGLGTAPDSGWQVFVQLENGQGTDLTWDRADTVQYILDHPFELAAEAPRTNGHDIITGGLGDDLIYAQEGNDHIHFAVATDGHDIVHGGSAPVGSDLDTFHLDIAGAGETIYLETAAAYEARTGNVYTPPTGGSPSGPLGLVESEVILVSNADSDGSVGVGTGHQIFVQMTEIEQVEVTGSTADDTFVISGAFTSTALLPTTIEFQGLGGDDILDLTGRVSNHEVVADGGANTGVGDTVKLSFGFFDAGISYEGIFSGPTLTGVKITHGTITDEFNNFENFDFTDDGGTPLSLADLVNDAPVNTVPLLTQTTNEDANLVLSSANGNAITISDADIGGGAERVTLAVTSGVLTLGSLVGLSFTVGDGTADTTMTFTGSVTNINNALNGLIYSSNNFNGGDTLTITTNDQGNTGIDPGLTGTATSEQDSDQVAITVIAVNDPPAITGMGGTLAYTENAAATIIDASATVSDIDSANFNGGSLTVSFTANGTSADQLSIVNEGNGVGQIGVSGANVTFGGAANIIGTWSGGTNGSDLVITFNASGLATPAAAERLIERIAFANTSDSPSTSPRTVTYSLVDGDGTALGGSDTGIATVTVNVTAATDAPVIWATDSDLTLNPSEITLFNMVKFADVDTTGSVTVTIVSDDSGADIIASTGGGVTVTGGGDDNVTFSGTVAALNAFFAGNNVTYDMNDTSSDTVTISINDGTVGGTDSATMTINDFDATSSNTNRFPQQSVFNINATSVNAGGGDDIIVTAFNHFNPTATTYDGGTGTIDTITVTMTPTQLNEVLSDPLLRDGANDFRPYFDDSDVTGETLNLDTSTWNAVVQGFEGTPHLAIAAPRALNNHTVTTEDNYFSLDAWLTSGALPALDADQTGDGTANLVVGTAGAQSLTGAGGNDILAAFNSATGSTLDGGANADLLLGSPGDDVLTGGTGNETGNDVLAGARGADTFTWGAATVAAGDEDTIVDYDFTEGDKIDLQNLVPTLTNGSAINYVQLATDANNNLLVQVDANGTTGGANFTLTYTLLGANTNGSDPVRFHFGGQDFIITDAGTATATVDPLILDLGALGLAFSSLMDGVPFDINADGVADQMAWTAGAGEDGILALDLDGSGTIDNGTEIFSPWFGGGSYASSLAALATLDSNGDGLIDAADAGFSSLEVWQDLDHDGTSDAGELTDLAGHGITSIDLNATPVDSTIDGQQVLAEGTFNYEDGSSGTFAEVGLETAFGTPGQTPLVNAGTIEATGTDPLTIGTGYDGVVNSGTLAAATGSGGLVVDGDLENSGLLWANGGNVAVTGNVSGDGSAEIDGTATMEFAAAVDQAIAFATSAAGTLKLNDADAFAGVVSGFDGNDQLALSDVDYSAELMLDYAANEAGTGGTLTVSDGTDTAHIALLGQYTEGVFEAGVDQNLGTLITYHHA
jgi:hypothetical protein